MSKIRLRLDPWPAEFESALQIEDLPQDSMAEIDARVETDAWMAVVPLGASRPDRIHFIDGVRRIEARVLADDNAGRLVYGMFGSLAVGAVSVERNKAGFDPIVVRRYVILGSGVVPEPEAFQVGKAQLAFDSYTAVESSPGAPLLTLQNLMRTEEAGVAQELEGSSPCIFADGPLNYFSDLKHRTVGVIKRLYKPYLSAAQFALVSDLKIGQRTPIFAIIDGKYDRYAWYLRLATPRAMDYNLAGAIRLEVRTGVGIDAAVELADISGNCLPDFASDPIRDPRSPQNLVPVGALEHELRRRLGDAIAIRRAIEKRLFEGASL